ncbi:FAD-binding and (Fe-S)-binding domain-containing protein [Sulfurospirillum arcachonense]|uniref:FAD-binding and (Fe-S)-binding domain-containing protein n=1 Tax=Sulfurospirillum arcachonense TaxID=57666 RepID=UPI00046A9F99|nr:FAD-binding and (Fe-S)-binding domain-containing protein [Sulfurospirillum arcachonense]
MCLLDESYLDFYKKVSNILPKERVFTDPLHTLAYGTDASFYRLIPKIVVWAKTASEVSEILKLSSSMSLPVVFRAAGTSLSGQAITDSILIVTSRDWNKVEINEDASLVTLEPSVIGSSANLELLPYGKKIGPDPASINSAMIGGIAANNASGMCCGISDNSYKTLESMKIIFHDGRELDTASKESRDAFARSHPHIVEEISKLAQKVNDNKELHDKIVRKFKIKNTCGYALNALVDFEDPIDIISHLMIGSEGTLGFIKDITFKTVAEHKDKASALMIFKNMKDACDAVMVLKTQCKENVSAAEIMDRAGLRSVENEAGMPSFLKTLGVEATAVLVETRAENKEILNTNIETILDKLKHIEPELPLQFTDKVAEYTLFWKIRKGLFPAVGAVRKSGTTVIIEDVAYPIENLAEATLELQELFKKYNYNEAIIFGHALEGNLHFVFTQAFEEESEIKRYEMFMEEVANQVAVKYQGSLKAEHGTGRNMAPFVELEWGEDAYTLMKEIKQIFDPKGLINPGVILNDDKKIHLKNFKAMPATNEYIDKCIECGFCEPTCPSQHITLTPRQRIASNRYMTTLKDEGKENQLKEFKKLYQYDGVETCATCSLCSLSCPVGIDTGNLTKQIRSEQIGSLGHSVAGMIANNYSGVLSAGRVAMSAVKWVNNTLIPNSIMTKMSTSLRTLSGDRLPLWTKSLPSGYKFEGKTTLKSDDKIVYFSSCINRTMANPSQREDEKPLDVVIIGLLERAGYEVIIPNDIENLCCGMPFSSKGYKPEGKKKSDELEEQLRIASKNGKYPILCDMSPCSKTIAANFPADLKVHDTVEFILEFLTDKLEFQQTAEPIVIHTTCSTRKTGLADKFESIAKMCSSNVTVPTDIGCCGFAGDRGFTFPELNKSALKDLKSSIPSDVKYAFSTSKTCEIGLSEHSGIDYRSIFYLVERCTK